MFWIGAPPSVPGLTRTPSISTVVWSLSVPRRNTAAGWPGPPARATSTPGCPVSNAARSVLSERSISSREITITGTASSSTAVARRVAVTTTVFCESAAGAVPSGAAPPGAAPARAAARASATAPAAIEDLESIAISRTPARVTRWL